MDRMLKLAGILAVLVVVLGVALPAAALPPDCNTRCNCIRPCSTLCSDGGWVTTCGEWGLCPGLCRSNDLPAAALAPAAESDEADALLAQILGQPGCAETTPASTAD